MEASIFDLRYRMKKVLLSLDRGEQLKITDHGREMAWLLPILPGKGVHVSEHPFFGMHLEQGKKERSIRLHLRQLRKPRYGD